MTLRNNGRKIRTFLWNAWNAWIQRNLRLCMALLIAIATLCVLITTVANAPLLSMASNTDDASCKARMVLPIAGGRIIHTFDAPEKPWLTGHRGIDIQTHVGDSIRAPANGTISFAGNVGGKDVVSIRHEEVTLTFEPAKTLMHVGTQVMQGQDFAIVHGISDHCEHSCLHWGIKRSQREYVDPQTQILPYHIRLLPVHAN